MMANPRFKIDVSGSSHWMVALFYREKGWWGDHWQRIDSFTSVDEARKFYDNIKDLPEYLP